MRTLLLDCFAELIVQLLCSRMVLVDDREAGDASECHQRINVKYVNTDFLGYMFFTFAYIVSEFLNARERRKGEEEFTSSNALYLLGVIFISSLLLELEILFSCLTSKGMKSFSFYQMLMKVSLISRSGLAQGFRLSIGLFHPRL